MYTKLCIFFMIQHISHCKCVRLPLQHCTYSTDLLLRLYRQLLQSSSTFESMTCVTGKGMNDTAVKAIIHRHNFKAIQTGNATHKESTILITNAKKKKSSSSSSLTQIQICWFKAILPVSFTSKTCKCNVALTAEKEGNVNSTFPSFFSEIKHLNFFEFLSI